MKTYMQSVLASHIEFVKTGNKKLNTTRLPILCSVNCYHIFMVFSSAINEVKFDENLIVHYLLVAYSKSNMY